MAEDSENEDEGENEPTVELGERRPVEGVPLARVASRLTWGIETEQIRYRFGETAIRTPDGPRELGAVLDEIDEPYFSTRREFADSVETVIGTGPIPTEN